MSGDVAIRVEGLGKKYRLGLTHSGSIREAVSGLTGRLRRGGRRKKAVEADAYDPARLDDGGKSFWALKDVSFEVPRGEVLGVIGRNGAGKSTLLKILSRITHPTEGHAELHGRVGSLLEVGTGFHPELTGRENVFMNGTILGMTRREVAAKFDEIVAFSGVEKFIDTPVKRYSSGMRVRLGFAVAAHLEPEILIVDEVLAVGDAEFQRRCLGRMRTIASEGRTVLFVSHNMAAVGNLCDNIILVEDGRQTFRGETEQGVTRYLAQNAAKTEISIGCREDRVGGERIRVTAISFGVGDSDDSLLAVATGSTVRVRIAYEIAPDLLGRAFTFGLGWYTAEGVYLTGFSGEAADMALRAGATTGVAECCVSRWPLTPGIYYCSITVKDSEGVADLVRDAATLLVEPGDFYSTGRLPVSGKQNVLVDFSWKTVELIAGRNSQQRVTAFPNDHCGGADNAQLCTESRVVGSRSDARIS